MSIVGGAHRSASSDVRGDYVLSIGLAMLAGSVDAVGFLHWHGLFVSFMSGNSTTLGAAAGSLEWHVCKLSNYENVCSDYAEYAD